MCELHQDSTGFLRVVRARFEGRTPTALEMLGVCIGADDGGSSPPLHSTRVSAAQGVSLSDWFIQRVLIS